MTPTFTCKGSRHYRYYTSMDAIRNRACEGRETFVRLNAGMVESAVIEQIRKLVRTPDIAAKVAVVLQDCDSVSNDNDVVAALSEFDSLWASLFPAEQARIARLLIDRVVVSQQGLTVDLRTDGLSSVVRDMLAPRPKEKAA